MFSLPALVFGTLALLGGTDVGPVVTAADFMRWFDEASGGKIELSEAIEARSAGFRYVFVGGFLNERKPGYFGQNIKELRAHGVPWERIHEIYPSSRKTVDESREEIRDAFENIASAGPERMVVIAHSRGACDALAFALENADFTSEHIALLFLVQGPFGGTPLADYVLGEGQKIDRQMPLASRVVGRLAGRVERRRVRRGSHGALSSFTQDSSEVFWESMLEEHADAVPIVSPRTYFITSQVDPGELGFLKASTGRYIETYYNATNDSIVKLSDQSLPEFGTVLGPLEVGHADLTQKFPSTNTPRRYRKALVQCVLLAVARTVRAEEIASAREKVDPEVQEAALRDMKVESRRRGLFRGRR